MQPGKDVCINNFNVDDDLSFADNTTYLYGEDFLNVTLLGRLVNEVLINTNEDFVVRIYRMHSYIN